MPMAPRRTPARRRATDARTTGLEGGAAEVKAGVLSQFVCIIFELELPVKGAPLTIRGWFCL
jgi:hypothetical protein